ncbi:cyclic nucleotide-binding domain-containing protein [Paenibacillus sp.]|uniref:cyclic nucleotide-binding domain-containing protein n=1 Tax=Paenibacillus sp. TaxID=58172 RepID=UPI002D63F071|nr:cyclic nucleotide-binding domain-containing protein [Paenibacillus sp.]HZG55364.1 cyclic nucleotide-binding domain-containing protein [Paenibacillus sp.]
MEQSTELRKTIGANALFQYVTDEEMSLVLSVAETVELDGSTTFIREGDSDKTLYLIERGCVEIVKSNPATGETFRIVTLGAGECVGESAMLEGNAKRMATVRTMERTRLIKIDFDRMAERGEAGTLHIKLLSNIARALSGKLGATNEIAVGAMEKELETSKARIAMGLFTVNLLFMLGIYTLALKSLHALVVNFGSNLISIAILALMSSVMFIMIKKSGYPLKTFGLTMDNWKKVVWQSFLMTLPLLAGIALLKAYVLYTHPEIEDRVFSILSLFEGKRVDITFYLYGLAYALFCPVQEFISRSGIQSALQNFLPDTKSRVWIAIILSNLMFSTAHSHVNLTFALLTFFPGLYWGWMYSRQRSLLGASVSHVMVGVWIFFIVGIDQIWNALF